MTDCRQPSETLSDFVDDLLAPSEREALVAHLASCASCRDLMDDLSRLKDAARALGPIVPPAHVWDNIQASLPAPTRQVRTQWMSLAAALVLVTAGAYFFTRFAAPPSAHDVVPTATSNANTKAAVETIEQELATAAQHYESAIAQLEAIAKKDQNALPADAAAKLQISLAQVDQGIAASRAALAMEPQSDPARDSLFTALRKKVEILQDTVLLMNTMPDAETADGAPDGKKG